MRCRVVRGLLLVVGRPDGRLGSQKSPESWVTLSLLQVGVPLPSSADVPRADHLASWLVLAVKYWQTS